MNNIIKSNIIDELKWRNILKDISSIDKVINAGKLGKGIYCGFDPSNDSLHLGNLLQIILLHRFAIFGFQPIAVIGGTTAMIGDPSGKNKERNLLDENVLQTNVRKIKEQLVTLLSYENIDNLTSLELIKTCNLLNDKEYETLEMIIKSINPNNQYQQTLISILKTLPLPWEELGLSASLLKTLYEICNFDQKWITMKSDLNNLSFKQLLNYCNSYVETWITFLKLPLGTLNNKIKPIKIINNQTWLGPLTITTFLRDIGKHFNVNQMLGKEMIANRLNSGISYTEFSYMVLQAYDFYHLYEKEQCYIQSGGSDQWGNITAGLDLIRKQKGDEHHAAGITINLLTKSNGEKFGKSEKGAIFLNSKKTSPYELYQFLFNQEDKDLPTFFNSLTLFSEEQIAKILVIHNSDVKQHYGQKILAALLTVFIHKLNGYFSAINITNAFFHDRIHQMKSSEILQVLKDVPHFNLNHNEQIIDFLVNNQICNSKRIARELIMQGSIVVNGEKITNINFLISKKNAINNQVTVIKKGKRHYFIVVHK
ncbi:tyrosine--tRNA ligase [Spiroplasma ixodetis]|uniref:tyrosine--tRNA ligase n=1 Tax=Spiroplasma ixodetis TaxID=2141 RepID=UPI002575E12A|nr:tyrosine--tRNA ligase [Spiroplasma ixodetis]WJG70834.1 tyrosyl-tRNA synthetase [Spiroplasma ixodetis Y32]